MGAVSLPMMCIAIGKGSAGKDGYNKSAIWSIVIATMAMILR